MKFSRAMSGLTALTRILRAWSPRLQVLPLLQRLLSAMLHPSRAPSSSVPIPVRLRELPLPEIATR